MTGENAIAFELQRSSAAIPQCNLIVNLRTSFLKPCNVLLINCLVLCWFSMMVIFYVPILIEPGNVFVDWIKHVKFYC